MSVTITAAERKRKIDAMREDYRIYKAEGRACGYEVETFTEYAKALGVDIHAS